MTVLSGASMGPAYSLASTMGLMIAVDGKQAPLALVFLSAIMLCVAVGFARLSRAHPDAGSSYAWIGRAFGNGAGAYAAWILILSNFFATLATALPAGIYTLDLFAPALAGSTLAASLIGIAWILASAAMLGFGLRPTALVTAIFFSAEMVVLAASSTAAGFFVHAPPPAPDATPVVAGLGGLASAMVLGIWMSDGWEVSASTSEETAGPPRTSGLGGITGLLVTTAILLVAMFAYLHAGTVAGFVAHQTDAMTYVAEQLGGGWWRVVIVATVLVSTSAALWTTMLYLSRSVFAMGRDGVLPVAVGRLDARGVPLNALIAITVGLVVVMLATGLYQTLNAALQMVITGTSIFLGLLFLGSSLAAAWTFRRSPERWSGVVVPLGGAVGLLAILGLAVQSADWPTREIEFAGIVLGVPFALWRHARSSKVPV